MEILELKKEIAVKEYQTANKSGKKLLEKLFGKNELFNDVRARVKSYDDACKELNINPLKLSHFSFLPEVDREYHYYDHRMVVITRALNEGWVSDPSDSGMMKHYVWYKWVGSGRGFVFDFYGYDCSSSIVGARHEFKSVELVKYFASQFIEEVNKCFIHPNNVPQKKSKSRQKQASKDSGISGSDRIVDGSNQD